MQTDIFGFLFPPYKITRPIRLIELFAGIGSQAMALRDLGVDFTRHRVIEIDPFAIKSYNAIHGTSFEPADITQIHGDDLGITERDRHEYIMTYSYPCQDVSVAGKQKGMEKGSDTRSSLLWEVERILKELQKRNQLPQILLMENVPAVISERNRKDFDQWYASLERMGYQSYCKLLNSKDYGVPQNRNRCFMISILGDYSYTFPDPVPLEKCLRDVLETEVDEKYYLSDKAMAYLLDNKDRGGMIRAKRVKFKDEDSILANTITTIQHGYTPIDNFIIQNSHGFNKGGAKEICPTITTGAFRENNFVAEPVCLNSKVDGKQPSTQDRIYDADAISTAITTSFMPNIADPMICASRGRNPDNPKSRQGGLPTEQMIEINTSGCSNTLTMIQKDNMVLIDHRIRKLTPLECWRLMDYTDEDFYRAQAVNSNTQLYKQAGNGIVRAVLMAIFKELLE